MTAEAVDHLKATLKIPEHVNVIQLSPDNLESPAELDNYLDIFDACISEYLKNKKKEEITSFNGKLGKDIHGNDLDPSEAQNPKDPQEEKSKNKKSKNQINPILQNSENLDEDFNYIDSEEEDLNNDILLQNLNQRRKVKNFISTMKETDERLAKTLAACEDLSELEEKFKTAMKKFLERYDEMDDDEWDKKNEKVAGNLEKIQEENLESEGSNLDDGTAANQPTTEENQENSDQKSETGSDEGIEKDSQYEVFYQPEKSKNSRIYRTSDFDIFIKNCLKMSNYQINVVDGRGGVRLVPAKKAPLRKVAKKSSKKSSKILKEDEFLNENPDVIGENNGGNAADFEDVNNAENAEDGELILSEQLREIFKIYNEEIYSSINDILSVYPESIEVMNKEINFVKDQLEENVIYNKSISRGKTDRKSAEIYFAVKTTLENVINERNHFLDVLEYIRKREQKIQVSLLMNQVS